MPIALRLVLPDGEEKRANEINTELLASAQADAQKTGVPRATVICRTVMQAFSIVSYRRMKAVLRSDEGEGDMHGNGARSRQPLIASVRGTPGRPARAGAW
jgi:hypothetical protein